jgi:hypothetical protein
MRSKQAVRRTVEVRDHLANPSAEWACLKLIQRQRWLLLRGRDTALADDRRDIRAIRQARDRRKTRREGVHRSYSRKGVGRDEADGQPEQCDNEHIYNRRFGRSWVRLLILFSCQEADERHTIHTP